MRDRLRTLIPDLTLLALVVVVAATLLFGGAPETDRVTDLGHQLRCPVCQSESVADSRSDTALAMQARIGELVDDGWSDEQILDHFVARYGDWILLSPPFELRSAALWLLPPAALIVVLLALHRWRTRVPSGVDDDLSAADRRRLSAAIAELRRREGDRP
ncbi:cytochrome c-type biogenesis protein CcmH [Nitriliruptoraceae bacterium ZYF776]|nr:cytochrome c-type biogenesis protein CcmH [Profundirhabdus halotolerans]